MRFIITNNENGNMIVLRDARINNEVGVWLLDDGVTGWFGTPQMREDPIERGQSDGDYMPTIMTQGARTISLQGAGEFRSTIKCANFVDQLNALACAEVTIACEDAHGHREMTGFLSDEIEITFLELEQAIMFELVFTCPDPLKYGAPQYYGTTGTWCVVTNEGTVGSYPQVHVEGPVTKMELALNGQTVSWQGDADTLDLDMRDMQPSSGTIVMDNAFTIPPGRSAVSVSSDGQVQMTVRAAWR